MSVYSTLNVGPVPETVGIAGLKALAVDLRAKGYDMGQITLGGVVMWILAADRVDPIDPIDPIDKGEAKPLRGLVRTADGAVIDPMPERAWLSGKHPKDTSKP